MDPSEIMTILIMKTQFYVPIVIDVDKMTTEMRTYLDSRRWYHCIPNFKLNNGPFIFYKVLVHMLAL